MWAIIIERVGKKLRVDIPACDILDSPEIKGAHGYYEDVAKSFVVVEHSKEHVEHQGKALEKQVEEADCRVSRVLNEFR